MNALFFMFICIIWGGSYLAIRESIEGYSPFFAAAIRIAIALLLSAGYVLWKKDPFPKKKTAVSLTLNGFIGIGVPWALLFWGEKYVEPALCAIINTSATIYTAITAAVIIDKRVERMTPAKWAGVIAGFAGTVMIFGPDMSGCPAQNVTALLAIVLMSILYGITSAWLKKISDGVADSMLLFFECLGAFIFLLPFSIFYGVRHYFVTGSSLLSPTAAIIYLATFSTAIGFLLFYRLMREWGVVRASAVGYVIPIISIILDWLILSKWVGWAAIGGMLVIFAALKLIHKAEPYPETATHHPPLS